VRRKSYLVVMRDIPGSQHAECVLALPGPPYSRCLPITKEYEAVRKYAASIGCQCCAYFQRRPKDSELVCVVSTYRSGRKDGYGRWGSTFRRWPIFKPAKLGATGSL
jgi:hypothetical protein